MSATRSSGRRDPRTPRTAPRRRPGAPTAAAAAATTTAATAAATDTGAATATLERPVEEPAPITPPPTRRRRDRSVERPRAPRHRLLLVCTALLAAGLFGVLLLNTIISQGAFRQHELEVDLILLAEKEEALARAVQAAEAPLEVEKRARALGMVPAAVPVFLRLSDGAILGEPVAASPAPGPISFKGAPGIQPTPKPSASGSAEESAEEAAGAADAPAADAPAADAPAADAASAQPSAEPAPASPAASPAPTQGVNP
jgi:hypothetical protein